MLQTAASGHESFTWGWGRSRRGLGLPCGALLRLATRPGVFQKLGNASVGQAGRASAVLGRRLPRQEAKVAGAVLR